MEELEFLRAACVCEHDALIREGNDFAALGYEEALWDLAENPDKALLIYQDVFDYLREKYF